MVVMRYIIITSTITLTCFPQTSFGSVLEEIYLAGSALIPRLFDKKAYFKKLHLNYSSIGSFTKPPSLRGFNAISYKLHATNRYKIERGVKLCSTLADTKMPSKPDVLDEFLLAEKEEHKRGFKWENHHQLIEKISEICDSISKVIELPDQRQVLQERLGELTLTTFSFCTFCNFSPHETTEKTLHKFKKRLEGMEKLAKADGYLDLNSQSVDIMLSYWRMAKKLDTNEAAAKHEESGSKADIFEETVLVENQARRFGFKWDDYRRLIAKVHDECQEVAEAIEHSHSPERLQEELGDLILATLSFGMYCGFDPKETIEKAVSSLKSKLSGSRKLKAPSEDLS